MKKPFVTLSICLIALTAYYYSGNFSSDATKIPTTEIHPEFSTTTSEQSNQTGTTQAQIKGENSLPQTPVSGIKNFDIRPILDGSREAQIYVDLKYNCGMLSRVTTNPNLSQQKRAAIDAKFIAAKCSGHDLSAKSIFDDLLSQARAGNARAMAKFATAPPLADPDAATRAYLEKSYADELPGILSRATASGDVFAMRLSAEYFSGCRIQLAASPIYTRSRDWKYSPQESLRLLQMARANGGEPPNSRYTDFERLLEAGRDGGKGAICPS